MNKRAKNQLLDVFSCKGFTLVELLVAMLIFAVVILTLFSSFNGFMITSENITSEVFLGEKMRNTLKRICLDFEQLYVLRVPRYLKPEFDSDPDPYRFEGKQESVGAKSFSSVGFASLAHAVTGKDLRQGVARISYYVKESEDNTFDLYRADILPPYDDENIFCNHHILCKDILEFKISYTDINGDEHMSWNSESDEFKYTVPARVNLKIRLNFKKKNQIFETSVKLINARAPIE